MIMLLPLFTTTTTHSWLSLATHCHGLYKRPSQFVWKTSYICGSR